MSRPVRLGHYAKAVTLTEADRALPTVWALRDVPDVELLCRGVMAEVRPRNMNGNADVLASSEEVLLFLFEQVVVIGDKYCPTEHPGILFRPFLYERLRWRLRDHYRHLEGRRGEKPRPDSLDAPAFAESDGATGADRLEGVVARGAGDDPDDWAPACGGLLEVGDRGPARPLARHRDQADAGARARDPRASGEQVAA